MCSDWACDSNASDCWMENTLQGAKAQVRETGDDGVARDDGAWTRGQLWKQRENAIWDTF